MSEQLPNWQALFLEQHALPGDYLDDALKWFVPSGFLANTLFILLILLFVHVSSSLGYLINYTPIQQES
jgi:hypothetical protein